MSSTSWKRAAERFEVARANRQVIREYAAPIGVRMRG
jgi:hypothetical protein